MMSNITKELCPVCGDEMEVIHGVRDALHPETFVHLEDCPTCGKSAPSVGYDCQNCKETKAAYGKSLETINRDGVQSGKNEGTLDHAK